MSLNLTNQRKNMLSDLFEIYYSGMTKNRVMLLTKMKKLVVNPEDLEEVLDMFHSLDETEKELIFRNAYDEGYDEGGRSAYDDGYRDAENDNDSYNEGYKDGKADGSCQCKN